MKLGQRAPVLATVLLGTLAVSLNNTALNPAMPVFMAVFGIDAVAASWVITAFMISMGMTMPLTPFLGERFGKKRLYLCGMALFIGASGLGMLAPSMHWVIAARALQGVAGGLTIPLSLGLIFEVYPKEERGRITGLWGTAVMLAPAVGPVVGGVLVQFFSWKALFAINLPVGLVGMLIGWRCLPVPAARTPRAFDAAGFVLVTAGVGILLATLSRFTSRAALTDPLHLALVGAALLCLALFVRLQLRRAQPLLNLRIFAVPMYSASVVVVVVQSAGMFGSVVLLPLLMQTVLGYGVVWTGVALLATALCASAFSGVGGRLLDTRGPRGGIVAGLVCCAAATVAFACIGQGAPLWALVALMAARGVGLGLSYIPITTAGLNAIPERLVTEGSAMNNILRRVAASVAVVLVSLYFELRRTQLLADGLARAAADLRAIHELFAVLGLLILLTVPLALRLPKAVRLPHFASLN